MPTWITEHAGHDECEKRLAAVTQQRDNLLNAAARVLACHDMQQIMNQRGAGVLPKNVVTELRAAVEQGGGQQ